MKQYDRIQVTVVDDPISQHRSHRTIEGPVIVLTIEELREVWQASWDRYWWEECSGSSFKDRPEPDFETYLTSKGITLDK